MPASRDVGIFLCGLDWMIGKAVEKQFGESLTSNIDIRRTLGS